MALATSKAVEVISNIIDNQREGPDCAAQSRLITFMLRLPSFRLKVTFDSARI